MRKAEVKMKCQGQILEGLDWIPRACGLTLKGSGSGPCFLRRGIGIKLGLETADGKDSGLEGRRWGPGNLGTVSSVL